MMPTCKTERLCLRCEADKLQFRCVDKFSNSVCKIRNSLYVDDENMMFGAKTKSHIENFVLHFFQIYFFVF